MNETVKFDGEPFDITAVDKFVPSEFHKNVVALNKAPTYENIVDLEKSMMMLPRVDFEYHHYFANGQYVRQVVLPAGMIITTRMHKEDNMSFIMQGSVYVWSEKGIAHYKAPMIFPSYPGAKRVLFTLEETVWATSHITDATTVEEAEEKLIVPEDHLLQVRMQNNYSVHLPATIGGWETLMYVGGEYKQIESEEKI